MMSLGYSVVMAIRMFGHLSWPLALILTAAKWKKKCATLEGKVVYLTSTRQIHHRKFYKLSGLVNTAT